MVFILWSVAHRNTLMQQWGWQFDLCVWTRVWEVLRQWSAAGVDARGAAEGPTALPPAASGGPSLRPFLCACPRVASRTYDEVPD